MILIVETKMMTYVTIVGGILLLFLFILFGLYFLRRPISNLITIFSHFRCYCGQCICAPQQQGRVWGRLCECDNFNCETGPGNLFRRLINFS